MAKTSNDGRNPQTGGAEVTTLALIQEDATKETKKEKRIRVEFLQSPTGLFKLAYGPGQQALVAKAQALELIAEGYAKAVKK